MLFEFVNIAVVIGQLCNLKLKIWIITGFCIAIISHNPHLININIFNNLDIYRNCSNFSMIVLHDSKIHKPHEAQELPRNVCLR